MFRYAIIIVAALLLVGYILALAARGTISGRFRTISILLLTMFLFLAGAGLYTTQTRYSVQSIQEKYAAEQDEILSQIAELYSANNFRQARELAEKYHTINDPRLDSWYIRSREAELLQKAKELPDSAYEKRLDIWEELFDLTSTEQYAGKRQEVRSNWRKSQENLLTERIKELPSGAAAQKALGYELLLALSPDNALYKQQHRTYVQKVEEWIAATSWSDRCSSQNMDSCKNVGHKVVSIVDSYQTDISAQSAEVCGVNWRPKGTLIAKDGRTAPEDGTYYLVHDWEKERIVLINTAYVQTAHPFPEISTRLAKE
jgi:hypothetical protein